MGLFKKGLFLGSLFGAGVSLLNTTKKGKEVRDKMVHASEEIYVQVKEEVEKSGIVGKVKKSKYAQIVDKKVKAYTQKNPWAKKMTTTLVKNLKSKHSDCKKSCCKPTKK